MQSNAGPAREDKDARQSSTSIPRYGPIYTPSGGQAQAAQQQQSQQQQTPRRDGLAPIAPAPGAFSLSGTSGASSASAMTPSGIALTREIPARPKRKLINLACTACQKRKSKCDGQNPCVLCSSKGTECVFVQNDKQSRIDQLQQQRDSVSDKMNQYKAVVDYLRSGEDAEATEILRRLRSGSVEDTIATIETGIMLLQGANTGSQTPNAKSRRTSNAEMATTRRTLSASRRLSSAAVRPSLAAASGRINSDPSQTSPTEPSSSVRRSESETSSIRSLKRSFDELERENGQWRELLDALHAGSEVEAQQILRRSRVTNLREGEYKLEVEVKPVGDMTNGGVPGPLRLMTEPKYNVKAADWTLITHDDEFASHLIRAYFRNEHPSMPCLDEELFMKDAKKGEGDFCSPMLFNAILSVSAQFCQHCAHRSSPWLQECWSRVFFDAAWNQRRAEEGTEDLLNLQTIMILALVATRNGRDRIGSEMFAQAISMGRSMGLCRDPASWSGKPSDPVHAERWFKARSVTVWSMFQLQGILQYSYRRGTLMRQPPAVPIPYENCKTTSELELRTQFELAAITNEVALLHFSDNEEDIMAKSSIESTEGVYQRLLLWHDQAIARGLDPSASGAGWMRLILHMHWHSLVGTLFKPFNDEASLELNRKFYHPRARAVADASRSQLRALVRTFAHRRGFNGCASYMMHMLTVVSNNALTEIEASKIRPVLNSSEELSELEAQSTLEDSIMALEKMGLDFFAAQACLKVVQLRVRGLGLKLKPAAEAALNLVTNRDWIEEAHHNMRSQYPAEPDGKEVLRVDDVIRLEYEQLQHLNDNHNE